jgi:hypothetical protein
MAVERISEIVFYNFQRVEVLHLDYLLIFIILHDLSTSTNGSTMVGMDTKRLADRTRLAPV